MTEEYVICLVDHDPPTLAFLDYFLKDACVDYEFRRDCVVIDDKDVAEQVKTIVSMVEKNHHDGQERKVIRRAEWRKQHPIGCDWED